MPINDAHWQMGKGALTTKICIVFYVISRRTHNDEHLPLSRLCASLCACCHLQKKGEEEEEEEEEDLYYHVKH